MDTPTARDSVLNTAQHILMQSFDVPVDYELVKLRTVVQDARTLRLLRYERKDGRNNGIGGEHFSALVNTDEGRVEGVIFIDEQFAADVEIDDDRAKEFGRRKLSTVAPELVGRVEERWIKPMKRVPLEPPHDAPFDYFDAKTGEIELILGKRFKMFDPETKTWLWLIISNDGSIIAFERDISWDGIRKQRMTEQWLYDGWVARLARSLAA